MNKKETDLDMGMKCIKYMIFIANFMFVMVGFLLISIGSTVVTIYNDFDAFMQESYFSPAKLSIAIGILIFFVALFGCVGAIRESVCLMNFYAVLLGVILILEISAAIAAYTMRNNLEKKIHENMDYSLNRYIDSNYYKYGWDNVQELLHCCGVEDSSDWSRVDSSVLINIAINGTDGSTYNVPESCCWSMDTEKCQEDQHIYEYTCLDRLTYIVSECSLLLGIGALCVSFIQLLGIIFARMLAKSIRKLKTHILVERQEKRRKFYEQLAKGAPEPVTPVLYTPTSSEA